MTSASWTASRMKMRVRWLLLPSSTRPRSPFDACDRQSGTRRSVPPSREPSRRATPSTTCGSSSRPSSSPSSTARSARVRPPLERACSALVYHRRLILALLSVQWRAWRCVPSLRSAWRTIPTRSPLEQGYTFPITFFPNFASCQFTSSSSSSSWSSGRL